MDSPTGYESPSDSPSAEAEAGSNENEGDELTTSNQEQQQGNENINNNDMDVEAANPDDDDEDDDGALDENNNDEMMSDNDNDDVEPASAGGGESVHSPSSSRSADQQQEDLATPRRLSSPMTTTSPNAGAAGMRTPMSSTTRSGNRNVSSTNNDSDSDDSDDDLLDSNNNELIPPTPMDTNRLSSNSRGLGATPSTPLTPLSDLGGSTPSNNNHDDEQDPVAGTNLRFEDMDDQDDDDGGLQQQQDDMFTAPRGTDIDVTVAANTFRDFIRNFRHLQPTSKKRTNNNSGGGDSDHDDSDKDSDDSDSDDSMLNGDDDNDNNDNDSPLIYLSKLQTMLYRTQPGSLDIDTMHLYFYNEECQKLYHQLIHYPADIIPLMDIVVKREMKRLLEQQQAANEDDEMDTPTTIPIVQVRPFNLKEVANLRCLDPITMDTLVALKGMIVRCSPIIPDLKVAHFTCCVCGHDHQVAVDRGRIEEPKQCPQCHIKDSYQLMHNRCFFADKQLVRLQETPDQVPAGQTPASVVTFCFDDLVDACQPGDKVEVTGVLKAQPVRVHPKITKMKSIYKTFVDVIHFRTITGMEGKSSTKSKKGVTKLTVGRIQELHALSRQPGIYEQLTKSLAPSIWELDNVKKGVLCMMFGGNTRRVKQRNSNVVEDENDDDEWSDDGRTPTGNAEDAEDTKLNKRGDINILLCGDPGTSKSQLLSYVHKLSTRGIYTSGKGSSAVGLTASVVRDPETKDLVLESGALVLSDRGICCIDEFDKMSDATRSILHEAMEQQTVSIAKAGIISTLNARTSILASANPVESRYNPNLSVVENIKLPPTLLSRFDLIYLILDSPNVDSDRQLAQHLVGLYYETPNVVKPPMDTELLRDYIDYARENIHPRLSDEATDELLKSYLELRNPPGGNVGNNGTRTISATPRQLESLIRTSEALAKMRYSNEVTRADAKEAVRLLKVATQAAATDPRTGRIDMDMINTGRATVEREMEESLYIGLKEFLSERRGNRLAIRDVTRQLSEISNVQVPQDDVVAALRRMEADGVVQFNERNQSVFVRTGVVI